MTLPQGEASAPDVPPPVDEVRAKVRALADELLGPFPAL